MIRSFADPETKRLWKGERSRRLPSDNQQVMRRKLRQIDSIAEPAEQSTLQDIVARNQDIDAPSPRAA